jgi:hypothetical protein
VAERARLEIVYVSREASRVRIPLSPPYFAKASYGRPCFSKDGHGNKSKIDSKKRSMPFVACPS